MSLKSFVNKASEKVQQAMPYVQTGLQVVSTAADVVVAHNTSKAAQAAQAAEEQQAKDMINNTAQNPTATGTTSSGGSMGINIGFNKKTLLIGGGILAGVVLLVVLLRKK